MRYGKAISLVIPTLNEEKNLGIVLDAVPEYIDEVLIVDGHSGDRTVDVAKKHGCKILLDSRGKGSSLLRGMKAARGDIIIMMDADCSHRMAEMGLLVEGIAAGYDVCMGSRFIQGGGTEDMPFYRKLGNRFFVCLVNMLWGMNYSDLCYGYRSLRRKAIPKLNLKSRGFSIETEMSIRAAKKKLRVLEIPSFEKKRRSGRGKLRSLKHGWEILSVIVREWLNG